MSTVLEPREEPYVPLDDPYRYGWRFVRHDAPDGTVTLEKVPLTLEDLLHPSYETEDHRMVSPEHQADCRYLSSALEAALPLESTEVLTDCRVDWEVEGLVHVPDVIAFETPQGRRQAGTTYYVATERARPLLTVEIVSPDYRANDTVIKFEEYYRVGVPLYVIVETRYRGGARVAARVLGYRAGPHGYEPIPLDERGWLWLETVGLWLKLKGVQVRLCDREGQEMGDYLEVTAARTAAEERARQAEQETLAADEAKHRAEEEARTEAQARRRAEEEARTAQERIRALEEQLRRLQAGSAPPPDPA